MQLFFLLFIVDSIKHFELLARLAPAKYAILFVKRIVK